MRHRPHRLPAVVLATVVALAPLAAVALTSPAQASGSPSGELLKYRLLAVDTESSGNAWAVGVSYYHWLYTTLTEHWNGTSWVEIPSPNPGFDHPNTLLGVSAASPHDVWAAGYFETDSGERPLIEHWDGHQWTHTLVHGVNAKYSTLDAVTAVSATDAWAVGKYVDGAGDDVPMILHWDGTAWSLSHLSDPGHGWFFGVGSDSSGDVWAVGRRYDDTGLVQTLAEHWDGTAWTTVSTPNPPDSDNGGEFQGVTVIDSTDAWAVGSAYGSDGRTTAITEHWDGSTWTLVNGASGGLFVGPELMGTTSLGADDVWAVGGVGYPGKIYTERYDGTAWTRVASPDPFGKWTVLRGIDAVSPDDAWAVGYAPAKLHHRVFMHWNGTQWSAWS